MRVDLRALAPGLRLLPEPVRHTVMRRTLVIDAIDDPRFVFKVATTQAELEGAYSLLHDCYVGAGLMEPDPSGMRRTVYSELPDTTTIVAKFEQRVIATLTLIADSQLGLPSDTAFRKANDALRKIDPRLTEVSGLAIAPDFRQRRIGMSIKLHLMKFLGQYSRDIVGRRTLCAAVHPRDADPLVGLMGFRRTGVVVRHDFVKDAEAVHISLQMNDELERRAAKKYRSPDPRRNLWKFIFEEQHAALIYPSHSDDRQPVAR